eukprot:1176818-Prorocentrum_minimum.AAC.1
MVVTLTIRPRGQSNFLLTARRADVAPGPGRAGGAVGRRRAAARRRRPGRRRRRRQRDERLHRGRGRRAGRAGQRDSAEGEEEAAVVDPRDHRVRAERGAGDLRGHDGPAGDVPGAEEAEGAGGGGDLREHRGAQRGKPPQITNLKYRERKKQREQVEAEISENTEGLNEVQRNIPSPARGGWVVRCTLDPRRS